MTLLLSALLLGTLLGIAINNKVILTVVSLIQKTIMWHNDAFLGCFSRTLV